MFIIAHFHTQPARNNRLGICAHDRKRESEREGKRQKKKHKKTTEGELKCEKETEQRE